MKEFLPHGLTRHFTELLRPQPLHPYAEDMVYKATQQTKDARITFGFPANNASIDQLFSLLIKQEYLQQNPHSSEWPDSMQKIQTILYDQQNLLIKRSNIAPDDFTDMEEAARIFCDIRQNEPHRSPTDPKLRKLKKWYEEIAQPYRKNEKDKRKKLVVRTIAALGIIALFASNYATDDQTKKHPSHMVFPYTPGQQTVNITQAKNNNP